MVSIRLSEIPSAGFCTSYVMITNWGLDVLLRSLGIVTTNWHHWHSITVSWNKATHSVGLGAMLICKLLLVDNSSENESKC